MSKTSPFTTLSLPNPPGWEQRSMFDDPTTPLTAVAVWNELDGGPTAAGEMVSERTAMAISTVYTCVTVLAEAVASLPCKLMRRVGKGREEAVDSYLYYLLSSEPNPEMTAFSFWSTIVGCAALTGNGYAEIRRDPDSTVSGLWPLHPLKTEPIRQQDGTLAFRTHDGMKEGTYRIIAAKDVLHFPLFGLDGVKGTSPIRSAREAFALTKAAEKYGSRWFGNGARADVVLVKKGNPPDPKVQREIKESWQQAQGGANAHKQAFLFGEWDVTTIGVDPQDSQFLALRNFQRADIAAMFHLPPSKVGDVSKQSKASAEQENLAFVTDTLAPIITRVEQELARKLLRKGSNLFVSFDLSQRLRGDFQTQMQGFAAGRQWGFLSANDIRESMGLNPIGPEGDTYLYPVNMGDAGQLLKDKSLIPTTQEPDDSDEDDEPTDDSQNPPPAPKGKK